MAITNHTDDPQVETTDLLKKALILRLFELDVPQGDIAKKLRVDIHAVNNFLKGIRKDNAKKRK